MNEEQPEAELPAKEARSKLKALALLGKQLRLGNIFRLSKEVLLRIRSALRDVLQHDDHADDTHTAQLLGVVCTATPDQPTVVPPELAAEFRKEFVELIADSEGDEADTGQEDLIP